MPKHVGGSFVQRSLAASTERALPFSHNTVLSPAELGCALIAVQPIEAHCIKLAQGALAEFQLVCIRGFRWKLVIFT